MTLDSGWNLPPGCHVHHIPGNRPEDELYDRIYEEVEAEWREDFPEDVCIGCAPYICYKTERFASGDCPRLEEEVEIRMLECES